jgi:hypothetical protein
MKQEMGKLTFEKLKLAVQIFEKNRASDEEWIKHWEEVSIKASNLCRRKK